MSATQQGTHSLAFRVMRLCKPSFHVDPPLRLDAADLFLGEDIFDDPAAAAHIPFLLSTQLSRPSDAADLSYRTRFLLEHPSDSTGLSGLLVLPQSFGAIYLGETFCSYISINNSSNFEVRDVTIKAEIQTERQRILLLDTSKSPVESIRVGGRYDFIVEHDVKELGAHTLVCTALYNDGDGERKYLPQFFKFIVANPLSVRTKVRVVKESTLLEACIENHTKSNLYMDQVEFEPAQNWTAVVLKAGDHAAAVSTDIFKVPILIRSGGGIHNFLYQLRPSSSGSQQEKVQGTNVLGKFQITWRTNLGESGRLQTQQILGTPITRKEVGLDILELPSPIYLNKPFMTWDHNIWYQSQVMDFSLDFQKKFEAFLAMYEEDRKRKQKELMQFQNTPEETLVLAGGPIERRKKQGLCSSEGYQGSKPWMKISYCTGRYTGTGSVTVRYNAMSVSPYVPAVQIRMKLQNHMDRSLGPLEVWLSPGGSLEENAVMINGLQTI